MNHDNSMKNTYLYLNSRDELLRLEISKVVYFEADGNYTCILMANELKGIVCINLAHIQEILNERLKERAADFIRVGKKYIINRNYVYQINVLNQKLILSDGERFAFDLDISKEALKKLKEFYLTMLNK